MREHDESIQNSGFTATPSGFDPSRMWVQFSDCGQHVRKWSRKPFVGAVAFLKAGRSPEEICPHPLQTQGMPAWWSHSTVLERIKDAQADTAAAIETRLWSIVDALGPNSVPSDIWEALSILAARAERMDRYRRALGDIAEFRTKNGSDSATLEWNRAGLYASGVARWALYGSPHPDPEVSDSDGSAERRDREDGLDPKDDSAGPKDIAQQPSAPQ